MGHVTTIPIHTRYSGGVTGQVADLAQAGGIVQGNHIVGSTHSDLVVHTPLHTDFDEVLGVSIQGSDERGIGEYVFFLNQAEADPDQGEAGREGEGGGGACDIIIVAL